MFTHLFRDRALGAVAAVARALDARMEEGDGQPAGQTGDGQGQQPPAPAGQQGQGDGQAAGDNGQGGAGDGGDDWKARAREWEKRAKENAAKARELDELKKSQMSELERAQAEAEENKRLAAQAQARGDRLMVAIRKGLPQDLADRLVGSTVEELEADADKLLALIPPNQNTGRPPAPDLRQGQRGGQAPISGDAWLRQMAAAKRGR